MTSLPSTIGDFQLQPGSSTKFGVQYMVGRDPGTGQARSFRLLATSTGHRISQLRALGILLEAVNAPGLERLLEHGELGDHYFYAFEREPTEALAELLARGPTEATRLALIQGFERALETLHAFGLAHGNLSPDALRVSSGDTPRALLVEMRLDLALTPVEDASALRSAIEADRRVLPTLLATISAAIEATGMGPTLAPDTLPTNPNARRGDSALLPDRYTVQSEIARGGMGIILDTQDRELRREVALKVLLAGGDDPSIRARFVEEAQVQGQLEHPNICPVHDIGVDASGRPYFTMKKVRGVSLAAVVHRMKSGIEAVDLARLLGIFVKICDAVAFAHSRGVIHRDLKPANVMVGAFGEVLVMDWGIAKLGDRAEAASSGALSSDRKQWALDQTRPGSAMGTPVYMAPEQFVSAESVDVRADVYALGAVLYELLTFAVPVEGKNFAELALKVKRGEIVPPRTRAPGREIPKDLEAATHQAMAVDKAARYASVQALRDDVQAYLDGRTLAAAEYSPFARAAKWARRNRVFVSTALVALALWTLSSAVYLAKLLRANEEIAAQLAASVLSEGRASMAAKKPGDGRAALLRARDLAQAGSSTRLRAELELWKSQDVAPAPLFETELGFRPTAFTTLAASGRVLIGTLGAVELWSPLDGLRIARYELGGATVVELQAGSDEHYCLARDEAGALFIVDLERGQVSTAPGRWRHATLLLAQAQLWATDDAGHLHTLGLDGKELGPVAKRTSRALSSARDGNLILSAQAPQVLELWSPGNDEARAAFISGQPLAELLALEPGAQLAAAVLEGGRDIALLDLRLTDKIQLADPSDKKRVLRGHQAAITGLVFSADGRRLLASDESGDALLWDVGDASVERSFSAGRQGRIYAGFVAQDALVVGASAAGKLLVWPNGGVPGWMPAQDRALSEPRALGFLPAGHGIWSYSIVEELFATAGGRYLAVRPGDTWVLGPRTMALLSQVAARAKQSPVALSSDGTIAGLLDARGLALWPIGSDAPPQIRSWPPPEKAEYRFLALGEGGKRAAAYRVGESEARMFVLEEQHKEPRAVGPPIWSRGPSVLSRARLAVGGGPGDNAVSAWSLITVLDLDAPERTPMVLAGHESAPTSLAFSPAGDVLYSTAADRSLRAWSLSGSGALVWRASIPNAGSSVAVERSGRVIAVGLASGDVLLFDTSGSELLRFNALPAAVANMVFGADGDLLVGGRDGALAVFQPLSRADLIGRSSPALERVLCKDGGGVAARRGLATLGWCAQPEALPNDLSPLERRIYARQDVQAGGDALGRARARLVGPGQSAALETWIAGQGPAQIAELGGELLIESLLRRNTEAFDRLLRAGADPRHKRADGSSPLLVASNLGLLAQTERLLTAGASASDPSAADPLLMLAYQPWAEAPRIAERLARGRDALPGEALWQAVENENLWLLDVLAKAGMDLNAVPTLPMRTTPLLRAVQQNKPLLVEHLLGGGADANASFQGNTALVEAARRGDRIILAMLLAKGADPNGLAPEGHRPLTAAMMSPDPYPSVRTLLDAGADPKLADGLGRSALALAVSGRHTKAARALLARGASAQQNFGSGSLLHEAVRAGELETVEALRMHGARAKKDAAGRTPLELARVLGRDDLLPALEGD